MSISVCPAPTLSIIIGLNPAYSNTRKLFLIECAIAPVAPRDAILRIYVPPVSYTHLTLPTILLV